MHKDWENSLSSRNSKAQFKFPEINLIVNMTGSDFGLKIRPSLILSLRYSPWQKIDTLCVYSKVEKCVNLWRTTVPLQKVAERLRTSEAKKDDNELGNRFTGKT